jgi:hypothetical protein
MVDGERGIGRVVRGEVRLGLAATNWGASRCAKHGHVQCIDEPEWGHLSAQEKMTTWHPQRAGISK